MNILHSFTKAARTSFFVKERIYVYHFTPRNNTCNIIAINLKNSYYNNDV
jgi:hypothetical protein